MENLKQKVKEIDNNTGNTVMIIYMLGIGFVIILLFISAINISDRQVKQQQRIDKIETILTVRGVWVN